MQAQREKSSNVLGIAVSILLHGIFFAGCLALDTSSVSANADQQPQPLEQLKDQAQVEKTKS